MRRDDSLKQYLEDQLAPLGDVRFRRMFGGYGVYRGATFFAILHRGRLYLRVDEHSRADYLAQGTKPFRPNAKQTLKRYYEVPADVIEDNETLVAWARRALAARPAAKRKSKRR